jgi:hypothetical protein
MKDEFCEIRIHKALLVFTRAEWRRALRRGRTVKHNKRAARKRKQAGEHGKRLDKTLAKTS